MVVREVAVIGAGGVGGLASLYELLHTDQNGHYDESGEKPSYFTKIVGFDQKSSLGGTWNPGKNYERDPPLPSQEILNTERYDDVHVIKPPNKNVPSEEELSNSSYRNPIVKPRDSNYLNWSRTALWPRLYTNVPEGYLRYSNAKQYGPSPETITPFLTHQQLLKRMDSFSSHYDLQKFIRYDTEVYHVQKQGEKWVITLRVISPKGEGDDQWYQESFDAVILAHGHYSIPYIPHYNGLSEWNRKYPGSVMHSKAYRDPNEFAGKRVVIVGAYISALDMGQYLESVAKEVIISRDLSKDPPLPFIADCIKKFRNVPRVQEFLPYTKKLRLENGELLSNVDAVILATGYHIETPFFDRGVLNYSIPPRSNVPTSMSRIRGLYHHVFNIEDPTLAFVGKIVTQISFRNMESQAAAICGIWSGAKTLPSKEDQYKWEKQRLEAIGLNETYFHKHDIYQMQDLFFDQIQQFHTIDRPDPIRDGVLSNNESYEQSLITFQKLFNAFRSGEIDIFHDFEKDIGDSSQSA